MGSFRNRLPVVLSCLPGRLSDSDERQTRTWSGSDTSWQRPRTAGFKVEDGAQYSRDIAINSPPSSHYNVPPVNSDSTNLLNATLGCQCLTRTLFSRRRIPNDNRIRFPYSLIRPSV